MTANEGIDFRALRLEMVEVIAACARLAAARIGKDRLDERVMTVMAEVPRHEFVPNPLRRYAYLNVPLPIGYTKTISQPFIVALMTDLLEIEPTDRVFEVGTGLGYQAAILAELAQRVYTVEIIEELAHEARKRLGDLEYNNIAVRLGDGSHGWAEHAPYDKIVVAAAPARIPPMLIGQLKPGGRMVIPAGSETAQKLLLVTKDGAGRTTAQEILDVSFAPLIVSH
jgi:protein-L-isoaspartate(D-aspartate) O-methyltransferase